MQGRLSTLGIGDVLKVSQCMMKKGGHGQNSSLLFDPGSASSALQKRWSSIDDSKNSDDESRKEGEKVEKPC